MNEILNNFFLTLASGASGIDFFSALLSLYIAACIVILIIEHIIE